jgi:Chaperone of endosialidase
MKTKTLPLNRSTNSSHCPLALLFIPLALACFAFAPEAGGTCQEGCNLTNGNTFLGDGALVNNTTGGNNTANGENTLFFNTTGDQNTATGASALLSNTAGDFNTANGYQALFNNTTGNFNAAIGASALLNNTIGGRNTGIGRSALSFNTTGSFNTANGYQALFSNTTGNFNIALGRNAGASLTTGDSNIDIGNLGVAGESATIRIGDSQTKTFIAGISGATVASGVGVIIGSNGQLGTVVSSARFKDAIRPMDKASEAILALQPVTFRYKPQLDPEGIPQFGLVAEDVEKVNPALVARDEQGKPYTVRYEAVNAMLLNEFLKEHGKVEKLEAMVSSLAATVKEQAAQIQKVSAQLELTKAAPQTVLNDQ